MTNEEMIKEFETYDDEKKKKAFIALLKLRDIQSTTLDLKESNIKLLEKQISIFEEFIRKHHPEIKI